MIVIRLTRVGKRKQPIYRVVVQDKQRDPWGKAFEIVGHYNPRTTPKQVDFKADRVKEWLSKGAQPSATVHNLLIDAKIIEGEKIRAASGSGLSGAKAKVEEPKAEPKAEAKAEEPKVEEPKAEEPKAEEKVEETPAA